MSRLFLKKLTTLEDNTAFNFWLVSFR